MDDFVPIPKNLDEPVLRVRHADLEPVISGRTGEDLHVEVLRRACPVCVEGVLLLRRSPETGFLLAEDLCVLCGQQVEYTDIKELNDGAYRRDTPP